jgi:ATP-dependent Clp protease protease subunit
MSFDPLLAQRAIALRDPITDDVAEVVIAKLLFLAHENPTSPIRLLVGSPGGHVSAALAIRDTMDHVACPVHVHVSGPVGGVAVVLVAHGDERFATQHTTFQLTPIVGGASPDIAKTEAILVDMLVDDTGQARDTILDDMRAGRSLTAEDAMRYGIIDRVA